MSVFGAERQPHTVFVVVVALSMLLRAPLARAQQGGEIALQASASGTTVTLNWTPVAAASSYRLEAGSAPGLSDIASVALPPLQTYVVADVPSGVYYVRLRALAPGVSATSNEVVVTVGGSVSPPSCASPPNPPTNLRANTNASQVTLQWTPAATGCPATGYILRAGSAPGLADLAQISVASPAFSTIAPDGVYSISVVATNAFGASAPSGSLMLPVIAPRSGGTVSFNSATPALAADENGNVVVIGEVVNRSLSAAVFIQVFAELRSPSAQSVGIGSTYLRGEPRRLAATGVMDHSALAPGEIGCFYIRTGIPIASVATAGLRLTHDTLPSTAPRGRVRVFDAAPVPGTGLRALNLTLGNVSAEPTSYNLANLYVKREDGRAVGCDFAFLDTPSASLAPGQTLTMTASTHAHATSGTVISWMHWQESGDPLAAVAAQTFESMRALVASGQKAQAQAAWESLQAQRRAFVIR